MNEAYVQRPYNIPVGFDTAGEAFVEPASPSKSRVATPRTSTTCVSLIYEGGPYSEVFCCPPESIGYVLMVPEIMHHGVAFLALEVYPVPYALQIPYDYLANSCTVAPPNEVLYYPVYRMLEPQPAYAIEALKLPTCVFFVHLFELALMSHDPLVPVPPVTEQLGPLVGNGSVFTLDVSADYTFNAHIDISPFVPRWKKSWPCFHGLMSIPFTAESVIADLEGSLPANISGLATYPGGEMKRKFKPSTKYFVAVVSNDHSKFKVSTGVFPVPRGGYLSYVGRKFPSFLEIEESEESSPGMVVFSDYLAGYDAPQKRFKQLVLFLDAPLKPAFEEALATPIGQSIPEQGTIFGEPKGFVLVFKLYLEDISSPHFVIYKTTGCIHKPLLRAWEKCLILLYS